MARFEIQNFHSLTLLNSQSMPTPAPFQQMLQLDLSNVIDSVSELLNLRFCADNGCMMDEDTFCNTSRYANFNLHVKAECSSISIYWDGATTNGDIWAI